MEIRNRAIECRIRILIGYLRNLHIDCFICKRWISELDADRIPYRNLIVIRIRFGYQHTAVHKRNRIVLLIEKLHKSVVLLRNDQRGVFMIIAFEEFHGKGR
ncbi:hypothetical protein D3C77_490060 [compost metagenome]